MTARGWFVHPSQTNFLLVEFGARTAAIDVPTIGVGGAIAVLVVLMIAYYCGGYVAGRMARFDGLRQGVGVWMEARGERTAIPSAPNEARAEIRHLPREVVVYPAPESTRFEEPPPEDGRGGRPHPRRRGGGSDIPLPGADFDGDGWPAVVTTWVPRLMPALRTALDRADYRTDGVRALLGRSARKDARQRARALLAGVAGVHVRDGLPRHVGDRLPAGDRLRDRVFRVALDGRAIVMPGPMGAGKSIV